MRNIKLLFWSINSFFCNFITDSIWTKIYFKRLNFLFNKQKKYSFSRFIIIQKRYKLYVTRKDFISIFVNSNFKDPNYK
jgi:hypothetical protein